jgi:hypothetical protein
VLATLAMLELLTPRVSKSPSSSSTSLSSLPSATDSTTLQSVPTLKRRTTLYRASAARARECPR